MTHKVHCAAAVRMCPLQDLVGDYSHLDKVLFIHTTANTVHWGNDYRDIPETIYAGLCIGKSRFQVGSQPD